MVSYGIILNLEAKTVEKFTTGDDDDDNEEAELSDDSLEKGVEEKRLSPEKEMALQALDEVLNEAEKSMGESSVIRPHLWNLHVCISNYLFSNLMLEPHRCQNTICICDTSNNN